MRRITRGRKKNTSIRKAVTPTPAKDMSVASGNNNDGPGTETDTSSSGDDIEVLNVRKRKQNSDGKGNSEIERAMFTFCKEMKEAMCEQSKQMHEQIHEQIHEENKKFREDIMSAISTIVDRNQAAPFNNVDESGRERFLSDLTSDSIAATHNEVKDEVKKDLRRLIQDDFFPKCKFVFPTKNGDPSIADQVVAKAIDSKNLQGPTPTNHLAEREIRKFGVELVKKIYNEKRQQFQTGMRKKWMGKYPSHKLYFHVRWIRLLNIRSSCYFPTHNTDDTENDEIKKKRRKKKKTTPTRRRRRRQRTVHRRRE